jgi:hypothetical protein
MLEDVLGEGWWKAENVQAVAVATCEAYLKFHGESHRGTAESHHTQQIAEKNVVWQSGFGTGCQSKGQRAFKLCVCPSRANARGCTGRGRCCCLLLLLQQLLLLLAAGCCLLAAAACWLASVLVLGLLAASSLMLKSPCSHAARLALGIYYW